MHTSCRLTHAAHCLPLQVQCHTLSASVVEAARRMGGDKVRPALELVGCAEEVDRAIKYAFGTTLVCQVRKGAADTSGSPGRRRSCA